MPRLKSLIDDALQILPRQPIVEVKAQTYIVVGDTHGYPQVSRLALGLREKLGYDTIIFLGDYVDRGPGGVENLEVILEALVSGGVLMIRGNHESPTMNERYGFYGELKRLGLENIFGDIVELYRRLPYIIVDKGKGIVFLHGGIPCRNCKHSQEPPYTLDEIAEEIEKARREDVDTEPLEGPPFHVLWNDPHGMIDWFSPSPRGAYYYGKRAWIRFLLWNSAKTIIRGHEVADALFTWTPKGSKIQGFPRGGEATLGELEGAVVTVFSSLYHGMRAGILAVEKNSVKLYTTLGDSLSPWQSS